MFQTIEGTYDMADITPSKLWNEGKVDESVLDDAADQEVIDNFLQMFGAPGDTPLKSTDWIAYVPTGYAEIGELWGYVRPESESIYVLDTNVVKGSSVIGRICAEGEEAPQDAQVVGRIVDGELTLTVDTDLGVRSVRIFPYDLTDRLLSRNTGLLESDAMLDKTVVLVGVGSVGSYYAMQMARSGVGRFVLIDTDTLEIHNICRHQCGWDDLGRFKVDAVRDKVLAINPHAEVITFRGTIQDMLEDEIMPYLGRNTLIVGGGDNRASAAYACNLACETDSAFVAIGCWTRAFAGEIFYWQSGHDLSCYECVYEGLLSEDRPESHAHYFGTREDQDNLDFEPGIAADIDFVNCIGVKVGLDLLNRDNPNYTQRIINHYRQYMWICNTNATNIGGIRAGLFKYPLQVTDRIKVAKRENCPHCSGR